MNIRKQLLGAAMATAIGAAAIGGGTYALFTDSAANAGNTFTAGTVNIEDVTGGAALSTTTFISNLAPGDSETATLTVENQGSLNAWVQIDEAVTSGDLFGGTTPVTISYDGDAVLIPAGESYTFNVGYSFPLAAGNEYQGDQGEVTFNINAVQSRNNGDLNNDGVADPGEAPVSWNEDAS
jgi:spore coat-associated protein N